MFRQQLLFQLFSSLTIILCLLLICCQSKQLPNIVLILADDYGWADVGYHSDHMRTPNIDTLAADGIVLNRYYTLPLCKWHLGFYKHEYTPTYRGFDTHLGYWNAAEDYYSHQSCEQFWVNKSGQVITNKGVCGLDIHRNLDMVYDAVGNYSTIYYKHRCLDVIDKHDPSTGPMFLYMAHQAVHAVDLSDVIEAPEKYIDMIGNIRNKRRRTLAAMAYIMDESVGAIVDRLHSKGMLDNTIVIFLSDNGGRPQGMTHNNMAFNTPLRGGKQHLWEGGIRVPAFIWSPLLNTSGYVSDELIHVTDILPTVLEAIGAKIEGQNNIYGVSQWKTLTNRETSRRQEIIHNIDPWLNQSAIMWNNWKLIQGQEPDGNGWYVPPTSARDRAGNLKITDRLNSNAYKVLRQMHRQPNYDMLNESTIRCGPKPANASTNCRPTRELCLYNIRDDPCEYHNRVQDYPELVAQLWNRLLKINETAVQPLSRTPSVVNSQPKYHNNTWTVWGDNLK